MRVCSLYRPFWALLLGAAVLSSCVKGEPLTPDEPQHPIRFGASTSASKAGDSAFEGGEQLGIYAFYNYYYFDKAESVLFQNTKLTIDATNPALASYSPLRSWTFSTVWGTAPHHLQVVGYFPYAVSEQVELTNTLHNESYQVTQTSELVYNYDGSALENHVDFMIAESDYDYTDPGASGSGASNPPTEADIAAFRDYLQGLPSISLAFARQMASLNFKVCADDKVTAPLIVSGLEISYSADSEFRFNTATREITWDVPVSTSLSITLPAPITLQTTTDVSSTTQVVDDLLDQLLYFPPKAQINKVVFAISGAGAGGETSYTWHPHTETFAPSTSYTLHLAIDPQRAN